MSIVHDKRFHDYLSVNKRLMFLRNSDFLPELAKWLVSAELFHVQDDFTEESTLLFLSYEYIFLQSHECYYRSFLSIFLHGEAVFLGMFSSAFCPKLYYYSDDSEPQLTSTLGIRDSYILLNLATNILLPYFALVARLAGKLFVCQKPTFG